MPHRAGEFRFVDITESAELACRLDHRCSLTAQEAGVSFLLAAERKCHGFKEQENVVLLALGIDVVD